MAGGPSEVLEAGGLPVDRVQLHERVDEMAFPERLDLQVAGAQAVGIEVPRQRFQHEQGRTRARRAVRVAADDIVRRGSRGPCPSVQRQPAETLRVLAGDRCGARRRRHVR